MNGTSDIAWEFVFPDLFSTFPDVQFYDYTKWTAKRRPAANYHLTVSRSESNEDAALSSGLNMAVVFDTKKGVALPTEYLGKPVVDGDEHDLRLAVHFV